MPHSRPRKSIRIRLHPRPSAASKLYTFTPAPYASWPTTPAVLPPQLADTKVNSATHRRRSARSLYTDRQRKILYTSPGRALDAPRAWAALAARLVPRMYHASMNPFQELLDVSLANKRGLTFYLNGQSVVGYVTKMGDRTVEVRNQQHDRVILLLDRIDGVAQ